MMQFRPGKLYVYMLDPKLSQVFTRFEDWGTDKSEIIDSKIKGSAEEIAGSLKKVREEVERRVHKYQDNQRDACYQNENSLFLCIMDFPAYFTGKALEDLVVIAERGKGYGINLLIAENEKEMKDFLDKNKDKAVEIEKIRNAAGMEHYVREGGEIFYEYNENTTWAKERLIHSFPEEEAVVENSVDLVKKITEAIRYEKPDAIDITEVLTDETLLQKSSLGGIDLPIGREGVDWKTDLTLGNPGQNDIRQHALIEGATGAGKSVLLHAIITSAIWLYPPEELQLVLLDYKEGVEFKAYADYELPSVRIVSTKSERKFGANVFRMLIQEMQWRDKKFREAAKSYHMPQVSDFAQYRSVTGKPMPQILLIVDEFQRLCDSGDEISQEILKDLRQLVTQGRSAGIHVILSTQTFALSNDITNNMAVRIALDGATTILEDGAAVSKINGYSAIFNDDRGSKERNRHFQVVYAKNSLDALLKKVETREVGKDYTTVTRIPKKIFYTNIADYTAHPFNRLIEEGRMTLGQAVHPGDYVVLPGESFSFREDEPILLGPDNNLLVGTLDEGMEDRIVHSCIAGLVYSDETAANDREDAVGARDTAKTEVKLITWIDFAKSADWNGFGEDDTGMIVETFSPWVDYFPRESGKSENPPFHSIASRVKTLYSIYKARRESAGENKKKNATQRVFVILTNVDDMAPLSLRQRRRMDYGRSAEPQDSHEQTPMAMLKEMLQDGSYYGINFIVTCRRYERACAQLGDIQGELCRTVLAIGMSDEDMNRLVHRDQKDQNSEDTAIVYDVATGDDRVIRIYDAMSESWLEKFKEALVR